MWTLQAGSSVICVKGCVTPPPILSGERANSRKFPPIKDFLCIQVDGGFDCPSATDEDQETCDMPECTWSDWSDWSECGGADCGQTGSMSRTRDCSPPVSSFQSLNDFYGMVNGKLILLFQADAGYTCPEPNQEEQESCDMPECNCYCPARQWDTIIRNREQTNEK